MDATQEQWLPVVDYEGLYEVSDQGRVKGLARIVAVKGSAHARPYAKFIPERILSACRGDSGNGYPLVGLSREGKKTSRHIHVLMLESFVGRRPLPDSQARHLNDVRTDNRIANLAWGSQSDNLHDAVRNGRHWQAKKTHCKWRHEFTPENTYINATSGHRQCRTCLRRHHNAAPKTAQSRERSRLATARYAARKRAGKAVCAATRYAG